MRKMNRRPNREDIKTQRKGKKKGQRALRETQRAEGLILPVKSSIPNRKGEYENVEEGQKASQDAGSEQVRVFRAKLPILLGRLSKIKDHRNPEKLKHKLTVLMICGILIFVFHMATRQEANR